MPLTIFPPREYAEMYQNSQNTEIEIGVTDTFYDIDGFTAGLTQGLVFQNGKELVTEVAGVYIIGYQACFSDGVSNLYEITIDINGTPQNNSFSCARKSNALDVMHVSGGGLFNLSEGDIITLVVRNNTTTANPTILDAAVRVTRYE
jgi:hypothetical protein